MPAPRTSTVAPVPTRANQPRHHDRVVGVLIGASVLLLTSGLLYLKWLSEFGPS